MNKVIIIGCGKIAGRWDDLDSEYPYGHALAYLNNGDFKIVGCVDEDSGKSKEFSLKYSIKEESNSYKELLEKLQPEVISICTPDESHYEIVKDVLEHCSSSLKVIFLEKPACRTKIELDDLQKLSGEKSVVIVVNHSRRFNPLYRNIRKQYKASEFGELVRVDMFYYGGWKHNGVHLVDIMNYLFSKKLNDFVVLEEWPGKHENDPTLTVRASIFDAKIPVWFHGFNEKYYQLFDIDLKFEKGRLRILNFESEILWDTVFVNVMNERILIRSDLNLENIEASPIVEAINMISLYLKTQNKDYLDGVLLEDIAATMQMIWSVGCE